MSLEEDNRARFLTLCWALWMNWNRKLMENVQQDPLQVVQSALSFLSCCQEARQRLRLVSLRLLPISVGCGFMLFWAIPMEGAALFVSSCSCVGCRWSACYS
ncbi:hypothetical protein Salat_0159000 [Sesamum alatum]|uniref:Uncharacterized protein n=1 Tax=Sesamum alatum TaxID=300844 RepID=A0AAE1YYB8_9LAMI|nr:hypothetical protein Salat_0159000 [Sesamum alatum]